MSMPQTPAPYCGPGPAPSELIWRWNLDPWVLAVLAGGLLAYAWARPGRKRDNVCFYAGVALLAVTLISPLCALSSALFSARVVHHGLLTLAAAPLLAWAAPARFRPSMGLGGALLLHAVAFWAWHAPPIYAWALSSDGAYWLMQISLLASALIFWSAVRHASGLAAAAVLLLGMVQMGLLGALITFAPQAIFAPHFLTTGAWGLSPLEDQQLAGLIMWAPMSLAYLLAALWRVGRSLAPAPAPAGA